MRYTSSHHVANIISTGQTGKNIFTYCKSLSFILEFFKQNLVLNNEIVFITPKICIWKLFDDVIPPPAQQTETKKNKKRTFYKQIVILLHFIKLLGYFLLLWVFLVL